MGNKTEELLANHVSGQANKAMSKPAHSLTFKEVLEELGASGIDGLSLEDAEKRLEEYGKNELDNGPGVNPTKILVRQIANAMMLVSSMTDSFLGSFVNSKRCCFWLWECLSELAAILREVL